jgi:maltose alpha-D-glucosyltransferase/alpha-amylase
MGGGARADEPDVINDLWYKNAIIYNLDVRTFMDSDGDGRGDFQGLTRRLDYLAGLGVTCLWLSPFYPSPERDDGYDVTDHYNVDPRYGSLGDFVEFTHAARNRGLRVILDVVLNHTSDQHPWFLDARSNPKSRFRDWYVWAKKRPREWREGMVFPGVQKSTWSYDREAKLWYFHRFYDFQPDLNTQNPEVQVEIRKILSFWLTAGASGFRMDAVPFLIGHKGSGIKAMMNWSMLRDLRAFVQWRAGEAVILAEANVLPSANKNYFGRDGDRMNMMFNFYANQHLFYALASSDTRPLVRALEATRKRPETAQWAMFLRNHDELDLGRLTEKRRQRVFDEMGPEKSMQLYNRGIRRRLSPMLKGDRRKMELAYSLLYTMPGTPVLRYGDELGMGDDLELPERDAIRTPMQWTCEEHGGFTTSKKPFVPVIEEGPWGYREINAADQRRDAQSFLNWTERMIRMRKECPEIGWGEFEALRTGRRDVLALRFDWRGNTVVVLHNFSEEPRDFLLKLDGFDEPLIDLLADHHLKPQKAGLYSVMLEPYGYRWYRAGGLDYVFERRSF